MLTNKSHKQNGFSLVELMVVVAIISILAALALPRFQIFQAKSRTTEAKTNLNMISTLLQAYYGENDEYVKMEATGQGTDCPTNAIGFHPDPCGKARYTYTVEVKDNNRGFIAIATSEKGKINPSCDDFRDKWAINEKRRLCQLEDAVNCRAITNLHPECPKEGN